MNWFHVVGMSGSFLAQSRIDGTGENSIPSPHLVKIERSFHESLDSWLVSFSKQHNLGACHDAL